MVATLVNINEKFLKTLVHYFRSNNYLRNNTKTIIRLWRRSAVANQGELEGS